MHKINLPFKQKQNTVRKNQVTSLLLAKMPCSRDFVATQINISIKVSIVFHFNSIMFLKRVEHWDCEQCFILANRLLCLRTLWCIIYFKDGFIEIILKFNACALCVYTWYSPGKIYLFIQKMHTHPDQCWNVMKLSFQSEIKQ